jgi:hypothetical protein
MRNKKSGKAIFGEYRSLKSSRVSELIERIVQGQADILEVRANREEFQWMDEGCDEDEIEEEKKAIPENLNQEFLVACFEGHVRLSDAVLDAYLAEKNAESPNYPLLRRYFRRGNPVLKSLLCRSLDRSPTDSSLLQDLAFFHEHLSMLSELIERYITACTLEEAISSFTELAMDFHYNTIDDGYEALLDLRERFHNNAPKRLAIEVLIQEHRFAN